MLLEGLNAGLSRPVLEQSIFQQAAQDLREMGLARAEETRDPNPHHIAVLASTAKRLADLRERVQDTFEFLLDFVGDYELSDFRGERGAVIDFDDTLHLYGDVATDEVLEVPGDFWEISCSVLHKADSARLESPCFMSL